MMVVQAALHGPVPSVSGQAVLTMPVLVPMSDLIGLSRQVTVLAYQYGAGLTELITPTNGALMAVTAAAGVKYGDWLEFAVPLFGALLVLGALAIARCYLLRWLPRWSASVSGRHRGTWRARYRRLVNTDAQSGNSAANVSSTAATSCACRGDDRGVAAWPATAIVRRISSLAPAGLRQLISHSTACCGSRSIAGPRLAVLDEPSGRSPSSRARWPPPRRRELLLEALEVTDHPFLPAIACSSRARRCRG